MYVRESPTLTRYQQIPPPWLVSTPPLSVVPALESPAWRTALKAPRTAASTDSISGSSRRWRRENEPRASELARSPAAWPPMPSATRNTGNAAAMESSLSSRRNPTCVTAPQRRLTQSWWYRYSRTSPCIPSPPLVVARLCASVRGYATSERRAPRRTPRQFAAHAETSAAADSRSRSAAERNGRGLPKEPPPVVAVLV